MEGDRIRALLEELGGTADEVAESIRSRGLKGSKCPPGSPDGPGMLCPLAKYLQTAPEVQATGLKPGISKTSARLIGTFSAEAYTLLPEACVNFVNRYDLGMYPDLQESA